MDKHSCTIIIDTNQFHGDFMLSEVRWRNLIEYLGKTDACLQMPLIIWEEIARNYRENLENNLSKLRSNLEKINHHLMFNAPHFGYWRECKVDVSALKYSTKDITERYMSYLKDSLRLESKDILKWSENWMSDIVSRAVEHRKPFADESDKGFKDTIIWKTILSLARKPGFKDSPIVLISSNSRDFGNGSNSRHLHPALAKEAADIGLTAHYFQSLDIFFEEWAAEALDVNIAVLKKRVPKEEIKLALSKYVKPYVKSGLSVEQNTTINGINFKVKSEVEGRKAIVMSLSGHITHPVISTTFLEFTAEATFEETKEGNKLTIDSFNTYADKQNNITFNDLLSDLNSVSSIN